LTDRSDPTVDTGDVYERVRSRFVQTVGALHEDLLATRVPATPEWTVHDVLAHVAGLTADLNAQRFPDSSDVTGTIFTARQVAARRATTVADILAEWDREAATFEDGLRLFGYAEGCHFVADLHAHHQDVCGALGLARDDDPATIAVSLDHYLGFIDSILTAVEWGTLDVAIDRQLRTLGSGFGGTHRAQVTGSGFEVLRAFSARRSERQLRTMQWDGDLDALLSLLHGQFSGAYSLPEIDLVE
jgi:hypothetical protein